MSKRTELQERSNGLATEIRKLGDQFNADDFKMTSDWQENWDKVNKDYDEVRSQLDVFDRQDEVTSTLPDQSDPKRRALKQPGFRSKDEQRSQRSDDFEQRSLALSGWIRGRMNREISERESRALEGFKISPGSTEFEFQLFNTSEFRSLQRICRANHPSQFEERALSALSGSLGGFAVAEGFVPRLETAMLYTGSMQAAAEVLRTATGADLPWPTTDDTSNEGEQIGENEESDTDDLNFGRKVLRAYKFTSKIIEVPYELIQDSAINITQFVGDQLGMRLGRVLNNKFTNGTGAATIEGLLTGAPTPTLTGENTVAGDYIIALIHSIDPAYRNRGSFMMHDTTMAEVRKLKDVNNQYLWQPGLQAGVPDRLLGYRIDINNHFPVYDGSGHTGKMTFGDHTKYKVRLVNNIRLKQDEKIETDSFRFVAYVQADGKLLDAGTNPVKQYSIDFS